MDTTTTAPTIPARKPRKIKAPRAGSITASIISALHDAPKTIAAGGEYYLTSRAIITHIREREGRDVPLRIMSATLAILRSRGNVTSHPLLGAEHGQMLYGLTERGRTLAALMTTPAAVTPDA